MEPTVSIIIPVYNAEKTLKRCVDSIIRQTYSDWELLLVDDGSRDTSARMCDEYALKDTRIKSFHQRNQGVSAARNLGLDQARGKWILFVDSDDYLLDNTLHLGPQYSEDLIVFLFKTLDSQEHLNEWRSVSPVVCSNRKMMVDYLLSNIHFCIFRNPWTKFFKRDLIGELRFDERIKIGEDTIFVDQYLKKCTSLRVCLDFFYVWSNEVGVDDKIKYKLDIHTAAFILRQICEAYEALKIPSKDMDLYIYQYYKSLCEGDIEKNPYLWYKNKDLHAAWKSLKRSFSFSYRCRFWLFRNCPFESFLLLILKCMKIRI